MSEAPEDFKTIAGQSEGLFKSKGSKFIGIAIPVSSTEQVKESLGHIRKEYKDARHHCYAYRLGAEKNIYRYSDDREPHGTAGKPIYGQILSYDLTNVLIVVVRYFGGTLLGVGGLIQAYRTAAKEALEEAHIITLAVEIHFKITYDYPLVNEVMRVVKQCKAKVIRQSYEGNGVLEVAVTKKYAEVFKQRLGFIRGIKISEKSSL